MIDLMDEFQEEYGVDSLKNFKAHILRYENHSELRMEILDVGNILSDICEEIRSVVDNRGLCLMRQIDDSATVFTDEVVFRKVCSGLLKNAIENTPDEGCIEILANSNHDSVIIEFRDHGVGIAEENQKQIFSGFFPTQPTGAYMSKKPYAFNAGGAGVDLLRIKTFADKLNFFVNFESQRCPALLAAGKVCPGKISICTFTEGQSACQDHGGSTFAVRFPAALKKNC